MDFDGVSDGNTFRGRQSTIRPALREDVPFLAEMFASDTVGDHGDSADPADLPAYYEAFDRIARNPDTVLYVAECDGVVAGTFQIVMLTGLPGRGATIMLVKAVHVRDELRGSGIGAAMMRHCIALARQKGTGMVQLATNRHRKDAHRFYERLGFEQTHFGYTLRLR